MGGIKLTLDLAIGETSAIESTDKGKIQDIVQKVKDLNGRLNDIRREQVFQRVSDEFISFVLRRSGSGLSICIKDLTNSQTQWKIGRPVNLEEEESPYTWTLATTSCNRPLYNHIRFRDFVSHIHSAFE